MSQPATGKSETLVTGTFVPTAAEGGGGKFPPFDQSTFAPQLVWLAIIFGALYWVLSRVALPRIGGVIEERRERIQRDLAEAERLKAETDTALKAYEQAMADARGKAQGIARETRDGIASEIERERQKADVQIGARIAETEKQIADGKARALASVNDIAVDAAGAIVNRLIGRDVPASEIRAALAARNRG